MTTQTNGTDTPDNGEQVTIGKAELAAFKEQASKLAALEASHRSVQRELERARRSGEGTTGLRAELEALEALLVPTAEAVHKIAKAAELETGVEGALATHRTRKTTKPDAKDDTQQAKAGSEIVLAAEQAGIADFETTWRTDERFNGARAFWEAGNYDRAVAEFIRGAAKQKPLTEADIEVRVKEAVAKSTRAAAGADSGTSSATTKKGVTTLDEFKKLPPDERLKLWNDPDKKAALFRRG